MAKKRILIIHPHDKTTQFLESINNNLQPEFSNDIQYFKIETNDNSHKQCLERIKEHPSNGIIIFLGHGRSDALYGSKGDEYSPSLEWEEIAAFPDLYYFNESFISKSNVDVFYEKKVFCLACNSNKKIAEYAIDKGAISFLGFGDIPTSSEEFSIDGATNVSSDLVNSMKRELNYIVETALAYSIRKNFSFENLLNIIQFITNQRITDILINQKDFSERYVLADYLYYLKKEAQIIGERKLKIFE